MSGGWVIRVFGFLNFLYSQYNFRLTNNYIIATKFWSI